jgi:hypothetical protein
VRVLLDHVLNSPPGSRPRHAGIFLEGLRWAGAPLRRLHLTGDGGAWYYRPAHEPEARWAPIIGTPGTVEIREGEEYRFDVLAPTAEMLAPLSGLVNLRRLELREMDAQPDPGLADWPAFPGVRELVLKSCPHLTDDGLARLARSIDLEYLELRGCPRVTDAGIDRVTQRIRRLRLKLSGCDRVTRAGLERVAGRLEAAAFH